MLGYLIVKIKYVLDPSQKNSERLQEGIAELNSNRISYELVKSLNKDDFKNNLGDAFKDGFCK